MKEKMSDSEYSDEWDEEESYESAGGGAQLAGEYEPPISSSRGRRSIFPETFALF